MTCETYKGRKTERGKDLFSNNHISFCLSLCCTLALPYGGRHTTKFIHNRTKGGLVNDRGGYLQGYHRFRGVWGSPPLPRGAYREHWHSVVVRIVSTGSGIGGKLGDLGENHLGMVGGGMVSNMGDTWRWLKVRGVVWGIGGVKGASERVLGV